MSTRIRSLCRRVEDRGASAVEYGLMVAAVAAVIVGVVFTLGAVVEAAFQRTCATIAASPAGGDGADCGGTTGGDAPVPPAP